MKSWNSEKNGDDQPLGRRLRVDRQKDAGLPAGPAERQEIVPVLRMPALAEEGRIERLRGHDLQAADHGAERPAVSGDAVEPVEPEPDSAVAFFGPTDQDGPETPVHEKRRQGALPAHDVETRRILPGAPGCPALITRYRAPRPAFTRISASLSIHRKGPS